MKVGRNADGDGNDRERDYWFPEAPVERNDGSREVGVSPAVLAAFVTVVPSLGSATLLAVAARLATDSGWVRTPGLLAVPAILLALLVFPPLRGGIAGNRLTAVSGRVWLGLSVLLALVPGLGLAALRVTWTPGDSPRTDVSAGSDRWVLGSVDPLGVLLAVVGTIAIVTIGFLAGRRARRSGRHLVPVTALGLAVVAGVAIMVYAVFIAATTLDAKNGFSPGAAFAFTLPAVAWLAAPAVAVLAGAER